VAVPVDPGATYAKCGRVSHDRVDRVVVLTGDSLVVYADAPEWAIVANPALVPPIGATPVYEDLAAYAGLVALAGDDLLTQEGSRAIGAGVLLIEAETGALLDQVYPIAPNALAFAVSPSAIEAGQEEDRRDAVRDAVAMRDAAAAGAALTDVQGDVHLWVSGIVDDDVKCVTSGSAFFAPCVLTVAKWEIDQLDLSN
jgi:hypothetical protein